MSAAEAGADYVMFGEPDAAGARPSFAAVEERVAWWAEIFELPCVGYAGALEEVAPLVRAGADFVALGDWLWQDAAGLIAQAGTPAAPAGGGGMISARRIVIALTALALCAPAAAQPAKKTAAPPPPRARCEPRTAMPISLSAPFSAASI